MRRHVLAVVGLAVLFGLCAPAFALADPPAQPSFVATSPVLVFHTDGTATTTVEILNPGPAVGAEFWLVTSPGGESVRSKPEIAKCSGGTGLTTVSLVFKQSFPSIPSRESAATVQLVPVRAAAGATSLCAERGAAPSTSSALPDTAAITMSLHRLTNAWTALVAPALAGLAFVVAFLAYLLLPSVVRRESLPGAVRAASSWNFKDNWATNLTVVGGTAGAVLGAAGANSNLLPGIQTSSFGVLLAFWTAVTVLAPLLIAARKKSLGQSSSKDEATVEISLGWFLCAGSMTLVSVGAELATAGVLVYFSSAGWSARVVAWIVLGIAGVITLRYASGNASTLMNSGPQPKSNMHVGEFTSLAL
ncbi:MAG TPA: hypothetical protein VGG88_10510 [Gaiellaceae bacterium]